MIFTKLIHAGEKIRQQLSGYRLKLFLFFLTTLVVSGTCLIMVFTYFQRQAMLEQLYRKGVFLSSVLARNLETPLFFANLKQVRDNAKTVLEEDGVAAIIVYDQAGNRIFYQQAPGQGEMGAIPQEFDHLAALMATHAANEREDEHGHWRTGRHLVFCKKIVTEVQSDLKEFLYFEQGPDGQAKAELGGVQIIMTRDQYRQSLAAILRKAALVFFFLLPLSLLAAFMLAADLTRPLRGLVDSLRNRLGEKAEKESEEGVADDALTSLDQSFRQLINKLDGAFAAIARMNEELESKVAGRTRELTLALHELRETQAQIVQSEKMAAVGQLVAGVAHEVNNTTNFITGALPPLEKRLTDLGLILDNLATEGRPEGEKAKELKRSIDLLLGNIREGARRTSKIVTDLKNFSRPDDDHLRPLDINQGLESTISLVLPEYKYKIELIREFDPDLPPVYGSQGQINQVFMNLIINAFQAQPDKGRLLIRTFADKDQVHIVFKDDGAGIPVEIQSRIFEPFFTTKGVGTGTGLGLSVSYGIISKHRGRIMVRSQPGQGTEFEIILPAGQAPPESPTEEEGT